jgi:hypothetical protein
VISLWTYFHAKIVYTQLKQAVPLALCVALLVLPPAFLVLGWACALCGVLLDREGFNGLFGLLLAVTIAADLSFISWTYFTLRSVQPQRAAQLSLRLRCLQPRDDLWFVGRWVGSGAS